MSSRLRIAVVGASVRGVTFSLLRAGCDVVAADLFADADLQRVYAVTRIANYPEGLADWLADTPYDGWLYTGALENHPDLVDRMAQLRPLLGNGGEVLRQVRDPLVLQDVLRSAGLNFPETKPYDGSHPGEGDWLHKTGQGGNGSGVQRAGGFAPPGVGYWQRRIEGTPGSAQYVSGELCGVTRQLIGEAWTGAGEFQYCGTLSPWELPAIALDELAQAGRRLAASFGLRGLFGIDFMFDSEHVWPVEVNPRVTAAVEVVERATGRNLLAEHLNDFAIVTEVNPTHRVPAAGKIVLYAKHPLTVPRAVGERLLAEAGSKYRPLLADIPNTDTQISLGEPILSVLADGNTIADVESQLRQRVAALEADFYRDCGGT